MSPSSSRHNVITLESARGSESSIAALIHRHRRATTEFSRSREGGRKEKIAVAEEEAARRELLATSPRTLQGLRMLLQYFLDESNRRRKPFFENDREIVDFLRSIYAFAASRDPEASQRPDFSEMEAPLLDARGLTKALVMAVAGEHRVAMDTDEMNDALERLALAVDEKINEVVKIWEGFAMNGDAMPNFAPNLRR